MPSLRAGHLVSRRVRGRLGLGVWGGGGVVFYLGEPGGIGGLRPGLVASGLGWGGFPAGTWCDRPQQCREEFCQH